MSLTDRRTERGRAPLRCAGRRDDRDDIGGAEHHDPRNVPLLEDPNFFELAYSVAHRLVGQPWKRNTVPGGCAEFWRRREWMSGERDALVGLPSAVRAGDRKEVADRTCRESCGIRAALLQVPLITPRIDSTKTGNN